MIYFSPSNLLRATTSSQTLPFRAGATLTAWGGKTLGSLLVLLAAATSVACDTEAATYAVATDSYPSADAGAAVSNTVYKAWFSSTLFRNPVPPASSSEAQRTVPNDDFAYAVLAPNWDPSSGSLPTQFVALKSRVKLGVARGDTLNIDVSDATFTGNCAGGTPLSQADADFITQRIFPGEFSDVAYDAATCLSTPIGTADAFGAGGSSDGGAGG